MFMALILVLPMGGGPSWTIWLPAAVVGARYLLVYALLAHSLARGNTARVVGASLNYLLGIVLSGMVLWSYWPS